MAARPADRELARNPPPPSSGRHHRKLRRPRSRKEFGIKGRKVTIIGQGTWYIDRGDRKSAIAALRSLAMAFPSRTIACEIMGKKGRGYDRPDRNLPRRGL